MIINDPHTSDLFFLLHCDNVALREAVRHFGGNEPEALFQLRSFLEWLNARGLEIGAIDDKTDTLRRSRPRRKAVVGESGAASESCEANKAGGDC